MRILPVLLAFSPLPLWAEDFVIATPVTRAALYLDGASGNARQYVVYTRR